MTSDLNMHNWDCQVASESQTRATQHAVVGDSEASVLSLVSGHVLGRYESLPFQATYNPASYYSLSNESGASSTFQAPLKSSSM